MPDRAHRVAMAGCYPGAGGSSCGHAGECSPMLEGSRSPHPAQPPRPLTGEEYQPLLPSRETSLRILTTALSPLDYRKWRRKPWYWRLFKVFKVSRRGHEPRGAPCTGHPPPCWPLGLRHPWALQWGWGNKSRQVGDQSQVVPSRGSSIPAHSCSSQVPVELVLLLTVPVVDPDKDDLNWKRPLNCLHILTSPLLCVLTLKSGTCKSPGSPGHPGGDGTEMATKAPGTAGALWSWHPV